MEDKQMSTNQQDTTFQLEVVERLTRMETKVDYVNGTLQKHSQIIEELKIRADAGDVQWTTIKKMFVALTAILGTVATVVSILACIMR